MPDQPDYFDRLLARQLPASAVPARVRVRPRLPGPFERAEGRWTEPLEQETLPPLLPPASTAPPPVIPAAVPAVRPRPPVPNAPPPAPPRHETPPPAGPNPEGAALLRPGADATPSARAAAEAALTAPRRPEPVPGSAASAREDGTAASTRPSPARDVANGTPGPARIAPPRIVAPAIARPASEPPAARTQAADTLERPSVQVRIGRLEVRTAEPERRPARSQNGGRRAPGMDLSGYLSGRANGAAS